MGVANRLPASGGPVGGWVAQGPASGGQAADAGGDGRGNGKRLRSGHSVVSVTRVNIDVGGAVSFKSRTKIL